jgi:hypothetical protein
MSTLKPSTTQGASSLQPCLSAPVKPKTTDQTRTQDGDVAGGDSTGGVLVFPRKGTSTEEGVIELSLEAIRLVILPVESLVCVAPRWACRCACVGLLAALNRASACADARAWCADRFFACGKQRQPRSWGLLLRR